MPNERRLANIVASKEHKDKKQRFGYGPYGYQLRIKVSGQKPTWRPFVLGKRHNKKSQNVIRNH